MRKIKNTLFLLFAIVTLSACEDVIDLELDNGKNQLVIDGFVNSDTAIQTIRITSSAPYFSNVATPAVNNLGARILGPNGERYIFVSDGEGNYNYDPKIGGTMDSVGFKYTLEIDYNGETYTSFSVLNPVPPIDSMPYDKEEASLGAEEGYYTQFYARDIAGRKDYYWIKPFRQRATRDGIQPPREPVYEDPTFLILSEDATFGGDAGDGLIFIEPFRASVTNSESPFDTSEVAIVELHSINSEAFEFLDQIINQSGNDGLFAVPPSNIKSNILDAAGNSQDEVLGIFSMSAVSKFEVLIEEK